METSSVIVVASASEAEQLLLAGDIGCPGCSAALRPHGHGRNPHRAGCRGAAGHPHAVVFHIKWHPSFELFGILTAG